MNKKEVELILKKHGVLNERTQHNIEIRGDEIEVYVPSDDFFDTAEKSESLANQVMKAMGEELVFLGGYQTGYGNWILREGYKAGGDWNDPSSSHHY